MKSNIHLRQLSVFLFVGGVVSGCFGEVTDPEYPGEPLEVFRGTVRLGDDTITGKNLRAALVWDVWHSDPTALDGDEVIAQDVPISADFPATFELTLFERPPAAAIHTDHSEGSMASGSTSYGLADLLLYEDRNENGRLDFAQPGFDSPDYIVGPAERHGVIWLNQPDQWFPAGYTFLRMEGVELSGCTEDELDFVIVDESDMYLTIAADPRFQRFLCPDLHPLDRDGMPEGEYVEVTGLADVPSEDLLDYECDEGALVSRRTEYGGSGCDLYGDKIINVYWLDDGVPVPDDWPCQGDDGDADSWDINWFAGWCDVPLDLLPQY